MLSMPSSEAHGVQFFNIVSVFINWQVLLKGSGSFVQQTIANRTPVPCLFLSRESVVSQIVSFICCHKHFFSEDDMFSL